MALPYTKKNHKQAMLGCPVRSLVELAFYAMSGEERRDALFGTYGWLGLTGKKINIESRRPFRRFPCLGKQKIQKASTPTTVWLGCSSAFAF